MLWLEGHLWANIGFIQKPSFVKKKIFVFKIRATACWKAEDLADGENSTRMLEDEDEDEDDDEKEVEMES